MTKLHLGCGPVIIEGFINIDMEGTQFVYGDTQRLRADLSKGLPIQDYSLKPILNIDFIQSTHFFEHLTYKEAIALMQECYAKLQPKGQFRVSLPNFRTMVKAYLEKDKEFFNLPGVKEFWPSGQLMEVINFGLYQRDQNDIAEHKSMWDEDWTIYNLTKIGFTNVKIDEFNPKLDSSEEVRKRYTFSIIGTK